MNIGRYPRIFWLLVVMLVLCIATTAGLLLRTRLVAAREATLRLQQSLPSRNPQLVCAAVHDAADAWQRAATISRPFHPVLTRLGFVPRIGGDLAALPHAIDLAEEGTAAMQILCTVVEPALAQTTSVDRLSEAARALAAHPDELGMASIRLERAGTALDQLLPFLSDSTQFGPYRDQLEHLDTLLPTAQATMRSAQRIAPRLPWLLGLEQPRTYLLALQNPFELRPTGGFIGLICVMHVEDAQLELANCQSSYAYDVAAPAERTMPAPYERYLRLGGYFLRDANWSSDFPTTAQTLEWFWELNQQPAADGVVAIDLHALPILANILGVSFAADGQPSDPDQAVNDFLERYYSGAEYRDKAGVGTLLSSLVEQSKALDSAALPRYVQAWQILIAERHLMVSMFDPDVRSFLADAGWDGGFQRTYQHTLRVVEADVGYGGVNAFVERLTHYDIALDTAGVPLTATVTLTFTNQYSPWAEFPTAQAVYGNCTDPATLTLERSTGCYASYVRVYAPAGSRLLDQHGLEEAYEPDLRYGRAVFGGYLRVFPGEQRTLTFRYQLPRMESAQFLFEKQAGTTELPFLLTVHDQAHSAARWLGARTDQLLTLSTSTTAVTLSGSDDLAAKQQFDAAQSFIQGLLAWHAGNRDTASIVWQAGDVVGRVADHATLLASRDQIGEAREMLVAMAPSDRSGRVAFERAVILESEGNDTAANDLYRDAAQQNPQHPLAIFEWQRRMFADGNIPEPLDASAWSASIKRHWRERMYRVQDTASPGDALPYKQVLLQLTPDDRALAFDVARNLLWADRRTEASLHLEALSRTDDVWGRLAKAQLALLYEQPDAAVVQYQAALQLALTYQIAYDIADWIREVGNVAAAADVEQRAATMLPDGLETLLHEGDELRDRSPRSAQRWYVRAQQLAPTDARPDFALGLLLYEQGSFVEARQLVEQAVAKAPQNTEYVATLDRIHAAMERSSPSP